MTHPPDRAPIEPRSFARTSFGVLLHALLLGLGLGLCAGVAVGVGRHIALWLSP